MQRAGRFAILVTLLSFSAGLALPTEAHARRGRAAKRVKRGRPAPAVPPLTRDGLPNVQSAAAIVVDLDGGKELYTKNPDAVRPIASVGKIFLALAVRKKGIKLDGRTMITEEDARLARGGARSRLVVGTAYTNLDLMRAMLIASDNRACNALGRAAGMDTPKLIAAMNGIARDLGLKRTKFSDPSGLNGNESTPREVLVALRAALADPVIAEVLATPHAVVRSVEGKPTLVEYNTTNLPLRGGRYTVLGGKTGYTDEARYCLAIAANLMGKRIGMVFLGAEGELTRFADFKRSADWYLAGGRTGAKSASVGGAADAPGAPLFPRVSN